MLEMSSGMLLSGLVIGSVGFVLFLKGKRDRSAGTLLAGIVLSVLPMVMHSVGMLWLTSAGLVGGLGLLRRFGSDSGPVA